MSKQEFLDYLNDVFEHGEHSWNGPVRSSIVFGKGVAVEQQFSMNTGEESGDIWVFTNRNALHQVDQFDTMPFFSLKGGDAVRVAAFNISVIYDTHNGCDRILNFQWLVDLHVQKIATHLIDCTILSKESPDDLIQTIKTHYSDIVIQV